MQDIMGEKREKAFTIINNSLRLLGLVMTISWVLITQGCSDEPSDDSIPFVPFASKILQLNNPQYQNLQTFRYIVLNDIGVQGVIVYKVDNANYIAYEQNCSFEPNNACAYVQPDASHLFMVDHCCGSTFEFATGLPTGGPAWRKLRRYATTLDGSELTITDEIIE